MKTMTMTVLMLALSAAKSENPRLWQPPSETVVPHGSRRRRDDLSQMIRTEQNRLEHPQIKAVERSLKRHVRALTKEINELDKQIAKLIASTPEFRRKSDLLTSVVGVDPKTAAACLAYVPELGALTKGEAAAIVGLAPHAQDSGLLKGHRRISGEEARGQIDALHGRSLNPAVRSNDAILRAPSPGKPKKVAITAVMRKMIVIINAVPMTGEPARRPIPTGRLQTFAAMHANW